MKLHMKTGPRKYEETAMPASLRYFEAHDMLISATRYCPKTLLDDEQVIACRVAHEHHGEKTHVLARRYGTSLEYMKALLDYRTRSKLFPP